MHPVFEKFYAIIGCILILLAVYSLGKRPIEEKVEVKEEIGLDLEELSYEYNYVIMHEGEVYKLVDLYVYIACTGCIDIKEINTTICGDYKIIKLNP